MNRRYGNPEKPETRDAAQVHGGTGREILSAYRIFAKAAERVWEHVKNDEVLEGLYKEAQSIAAELRNYSISSKAVLECIAPEAKKLDYTGLFLSAMLNETSLNPLVIDSAFPKTRWAGYRIREGKGLAMLKFTVSENIGLLGMGTAINFGNTSAIGTSAQAGLYLNMEHADGMAIHPAGGTHINAGEVIELGRRVPQNSLLLSTGYAWTSFEESKIKPDKETSRLLSKIKSAGDGLSDPALVKFVSPEVVEELEKKLFETSDQLERHVKERYGKQ